MKVGKQENKEEKPSNGEDVKEQPELKYEDLFNEKGEFK